jgi:hypothetical protein
MTTKTRFFPAEDYREGRCSPRQFHRQFIDETVLQIVKVGIGERDIRRSTERYFNDIDTRRWDLIAPAIQRHLHAKIKKSGAFVSLALLVCIAKEAAVLIKGE